LDTAGVSHCFHPRIAAMLREPLSMPQHAVVVASCVPTGDPAPRVFAWIVERPAVPVDAGVADASADASDDAVADASSDAGADATPIDGAAVSTDSGSQAVSFRGSGCTCRASGSRTAGAHDAWRFGSLLALLAFASANRRHRTAR
jgi:hypothetical protein